MKKLFTALILGLIAFSAFNLNAQSVSRKAMLDSLTTIDSEIRKYFPRWKICEADLQIQIYRTFKLLGYDESKLDMTNVEVLAMPKNYWDEPYNLLAISCGEATMNANEIEENLGILVDYISGEEGYASGYPTGERDYCYEDIPTNIPVTENQASAIINYLEPTNVTHSFTLSLFDQSLKIGDSDFWLKSQFGNDAIGYPFWTSGDSKVVLKRPLYVNRDERTSELFPYLLSAYLGGGYRITTGLENRSGFFDFLPTRKLNGAPNGKLIAGLDFKAPFHPFVGVHFNLETPINSENHMAIDKDAFGTYDPNNVQFNRTSQHHEFGDSIRSVAPIFSSSGQVTLFYNWWLNEDRPENYFRVDLGISYSEVQEYAMYSIGLEDEQERDAGDYLTTSDVNGLRNYKPSEFGDWLYLKAEYRNQSAYPFGVSLQYSNQIFLGRVYLPLISPWLYIEGKYSTPLRTPRPYEIENFFMISPVLRITI